MSQVRHISWTSEWLGDNSNYYFAFAADDARFVDVAAGCHDVTRRMDGRNATIPLPPYQPPIVFHRAGCRSRCWMAVSLAALPS